MVVRAVGPAVRAQHVVHVQKGLLPVRALAVLLPTPDARRAAAARFGSPMNGRAGRAAAGRKHGLREHPYLYTASLMLTNKNGDLLDIVNISTGVRKVDFTSGCV